MQLKGKRAFVTGGSRGIGKAIVEELAHHGASVGFTYFRHEKEALALAKSLDRPSFPVRAFACDVRNAQQLQNTIQACARQMGGLDILVNNAGSWKIVDELEVPESEWEEELQVNLKAPYFAIQAALPHMKKGGKIVNIASAVAYKGSKFNLAYAAAKAGVVVMTKQLSKTLGPKGICINAIAPGPIDTDFLNPMNSAAQRKKWEAEIPLGRMGTAQDVAHVALFLASPLSGFVTGQTILVDGGRT